MTGIWRIQLQNVSCFGFNIVKVIHGEIHEVVKVADARILTLHFASPAYLNCA